MYFYFLYDLNMGFSGIKTECRGIILPKLIKIIFDRAAMFSCPISFNEGF